MLGLALGMVVLWGAQALAQVPLDEGTPPGGLDGGTPFAGAFERCRNCHDKDSSLEPALLYMPFDGWVSSMMGNSVRDPLFQAALTVANQDVPGVGQWCLRCHAPQAFVRGHTLPPDGGAFDALDQEGVTCDVCHRSLVPPNVPGAPFLSNAQLFFETGIFKHGPYENQFSSGHEGAQSTFTGSSELCGQCHRVMSPLVPWRDADGGVLGPRFPLDTTYEEWKASAYAFGLRAQSCADCHMPRQSGTLAVAKLGPTRTGPRRHVLVGGNVWGLEAVQAANPELGPYAEQFAETKKATLENLRAATELSLTVPSGPLEAGTHTSVTVRVKNLSGHKLPTGYADGRRVFLQLKVGDRVVSGAYDQASAELLPDSQLRVYEAVHGQVGKGPEEHLALHDYIVKDTRIPPAGFVPTAATRPVGTSWFDEVDGGVRDYDEATFDFTLPEVAGDVTVSASLFFQSTTRHYVDFLREQNHTDDKGQKLAQVYEATGKAPPIEMARAEATLTVQAASPNEVEPPRPCGCQAGGVGVFALGALFLLWRRR